MAKGQLGHFYILFELCLLWYLLFSPVYFFSGHTLCNEFVLEMLTYLPMWNPLEVRVRFHKVETCFFVELVENRKSWTFHFSVLQNILLVVGQRQLMQSCVGDRKLEQANIKMDIVKFMTYNELKNLKGFGTNFRWLSVKNCKVY